MIRTCEHGRGSRLGNSLSQTSEENFIDQEAHEMKIHLSLSSTAVAFGATSGLREHRPAAKIRLSRASGCVDTLLLACHDKRHRLFTSQS